MVVDGPIMTTAAERIRLPGEFADPGVHPNPLRSHPDPFDVIHQALGLVRLNAATFVRSELRSPWAYQVPAVADVPGILPPGTGSLVTCHIIAQGRCWFALQADGIRHYLAAGDVVVMPYGDAYTFGSAEATEPVPVMSVLPPTPWTEFPRIVQPDLPGTTSSDNGESTTVVTGFLRGDAVLFDPILRALPSLFVVHPPPGPAAAWVRASAEYAMNPPQSSSRLPEMLFVELLRLYLQDSRDPQLTGWLAALHDPLVGHALSLLHADPAHDWTVAELAVAVLASKTVLVDRFHQLLGRPPIRYLTEWRLHMASGLLRTSVLSIGEIGARVGYHSEPAFSRAFKRALGQAPVRWRADRSWREGRSVLPSPHPPSPF